MKRWNAVLVCFLWLSIIVLSGCAGTNKKTVRKPVENTMKKIAVIGESEIYYPRMRGKSSVFDLSASKKALEINLAKIEDILKKRGYEINYCKPAAVGYLYINDENWVCDNCENGNKKWQIKNGETVFEYADVKENEGFGRAVKKALEHAKVSPADVSPLKYDFDLAAVRDFTKADTLCFNRIYGVKFTTARKVGALAAEAGIAVLGAMFGVYTPLQGPPQDMVGSSLTCINSSTGEVIWGARHSFYDDPLNIKGIVMESLLDKFPSQGEPIRAGM